MAETTPNFCQIVAAFSVLGRTMIRLICDGRDLQADENSGTCIDDTHFGRSLLIVIEAKGQSNRRSDIPIAAIYRRALIVTGFIASVAFADDPTTATANYLPSEQQVLTFIADTIDWYRHLPTAQ